MPTYLVTPAVKLLLTAPPGTPFVDIDLTLLLPGPVWTAGEELLMRGFLPSKSKKNYEIRIY